MEKKTPPIMAWLEYEKDNEHISLSFRGTE